MSWNTVSNSMLLVRASLNILFVGRSVIKTLVYLLCSSMIYQSKIIALRGKGHTQNLIIEKMTLSITIAITVTFTLTNIIIEEVTFAKAWYTAHVGDSHWPWTSRKLPKIAVGFCLVIIYQWNILDQKQKTRKELVGKFLRYCH